MGTEGQSRDWKGVKKGGEEGEGREGKGKGCHKENGRQEEGGRSQLPSHSSPSAVKLTLISHFLACISALHPG